MVADSDFAGTRLADRNMFEREDFGSAGLVESDGLGHQLFLLFSLFDQIARVCLALFTFHDIILIFDDTKAAGGSTWHRLSGRHRWAVIWNAWLL